MPGVLERETTKQLFIRLVPFLLLVYFMNCIDRSNISIAALTMNSDLKLSSAEFGIASGIFFTGYLLFEMPIAVITQAVGGRRAIGVMMIFWGIFSAANGLVNTAHQFYLVRLLLGVAEAGFFPALVLYLSCWFPAAYRGRVLGLTMLALPLSSALGAPLSTFLLVNFDYLFGLEGWRWLFIIEGVPATLLGLCCILLLTDHPKQAKWLSAEQAKWLQKQLEAEKSDLEAVGNHSVLRAITNGSVLLLSLIMFLVVSALYGSVFWIPQLLETMVPSKMEVGFLTSIPYIFAGIAMYFWARHSDRHAEKIWHLVIAVSIGILGFTLTGIWISTPLIAVIGLCLACVGIYAGLPILWTLPTSFMTGRAAAAALAMITIFGNSSGVIVSPLIGWSKQVTGNFSVAMFGLAITMLLAVVLLLTIRNRGDFRPVIKLSHASATI